MESPSDDWRTCEAAGNSLLFKSGDIHEAVALLRSCVQWRAKAMSEDFSVSQATVLRHSLVEYLSSIDMRQPPVGTKSALIVALRLMTETMWARKNACARLVTHLEKTQTEELSRQTIAAAILLLDDWRDRG